MRKASLVGLITLVVLIISGGTAYAHVTKTSDDGKYRVTLGLRPEPAITEKDVVIEARVVRAADGSPVTGLKNVSFTISVEGKEVSRLGGRESRERGAGWYDSSPVIFTQPGTYGVALSFIDPDGKSYRLEFEISIADRSQLYIPGPPEWQETLEHMHEEEHRLASTVGNLNLTVKSLEDRVKGLEGEVMRIDSAIAGLRGAGELSYYVYASLGIAVIALALGILSILGIRRS